WRDWNQRYYDAVELAAAHGLRFDFGMGQPGFQAGTLSQLVAVVAGRLRNAAEALEDPNEFDLFGGMAHWPSALAAYARALPGPAPVRAVCTLRTWLDNLASCIRRTYPSELPAAHPDPARVDPHQNFGLLRYDFTPKPASSALRNLLPLPGSGRPNHALRPLD